jgi:hypothetical protein
MSIRRKLKRTGRAVALVMGKRVGMMTCWKLCNAHKHVERLTGSAPFPFWFSFFPLYKGFTLHTFVSLLLAPGPDLATISVFTPCPIAEGQVLLSAFINQLPTSLEESFLFIFQKGKGIVSLCFSGV